MTDAKNDDQPDAIEQLHARLAVLDRSLLTATLGDMFLEVVDACGLSATSSAVLVRVGAAVAAHRGAATAESAEVVRQLMGGAELHSDGAAGAVVEASALLRRAALLLLDEAAGPGAARIVGQALIPALSATDHSIDHARAGRWARRWIDRLANAAPRILWRVDDRFELRLAWSARGRMTLVGTGQAALLTEILDRKRTRRRPPTTLAGVQRRVGGNSTLVELPTGRPLRDAWPRRAPLELAIDAVLGLASAAETMRRYEPGFYLGALPTELAWCAGASVYVHHLGLVRALVADGAASLALARAHEDGGAIEQPEQHDAFHLASLFACMAADAAPVDALADDPRRGDAFAASLAAHVPGALAETLRRCVRPLGQRPDLRELCDALLDAREQLPVNPHADDAQVVSDEIARRSADRIAALVAGGERDATALLAIVRSDELRDAIMRDRPDLDPATVEATLAAETGYALLEPLAAALRSDARRHGAEHHARLDRAFASCEAGGIVARVASYDSTSAAVMDLLDEFSDGAPTRPRGYVVFARPEVDDCRETGVLRLTYGAMSGDGHDGCVIGGEVAQALHDAGLRVEWSGFREDTVDVIGFPWSKKDRRA